MLRLRIVFMGSADLAIPGFTALLNQPDFEIAALVTQPDRARGRDLKVEFSPIKKVATEAGIPVLQPLKSRDPKFLEELSAFDPALLVVIAFGQILPQTVLDLPQFGSLNVHTSLLPKYRGAAPIQWAVYNGEAETGVTLMQMDAGLDTGPIVAMEKTPILPSDNGQTLHDRLGQMGAALLLKSVPDYCAGKIQPHPQPAEGSTYASKINKEHGRVDWSRGAEQIWNQIRAFNPWPGTFTSAEINGAQALLKIWAAEVLEQDPGNSGARSGSVVSASKAGIDVVCGFRLLRILTVQKEGGKRLSAEQFLTGNKLALGTVLGEGFTVN